MYLLDTNALLYFLYDSGKLSKRASDIIYHNDEKINVSIVSMWEIAIKSSIGKLKIKSSITRIAETCEKEQLGLLPIKPLRFFLIATFARFPSIITSTIAGANATSGNFHITIAIYAITIIVSLIGILIYNKYSKKEIIS